MAKTHKWLRLFESFIADIRIVSKEVVSTDPRGAPLVLWESQKRFINEVGTGLDNDIHEFYVLKSRQLGVTTVSLAIDVFWLAMHDNIIAALVTDNEANREANRALITKYVSSFDDGYFGGGFRIVNSNREMMIFSNGATIRFLVAGTKRKSIAWAEGTGYSMIHATEVAKYADENAKGLQSLLEGFAQTNPNRLLIMESTSNGFNHWKTRWEAGGANYLTQRSFFIGWWSGDTNRIERSDPRFLVHSRFPPSKEERDKIAAVKKLYNWDISLEQLTWLRWKESAAGREQDLLQQNQPYTAGDAFVEAGYSFFQTRVINKDLKQIFDAAKPGADPSRYIYKGYMYNVVDDFFSFSMEKLDPKPENRELIELRVWEEPQPTGRYVVGFDVAYGRNDHKDGNCLWHDTEILTKTGWKTCDEVVIGDEAVCFDIENESYLYGAISDIIIQEYDGPMYNFISKGLDCLVTPDHRIVSRNYRRLRDGRKQDWSFYSAEEIATAGRSVREIPIGGSPAGSGIVGLSLDDCRIIGWIVTDGHIKKVSTGPRARSSIVLAQAEITVKGGTNISEAMLDVIGRNCPNSRVEYISAKGRASRSIRIHIGVDEAAKFIRWIKPPKRFARELLEQASAEQLEAIFNGVTEGDGGWEEPWGYRSIAPGKNEDLADDLQELALKLGYSSTKAVQVAADGSWQWIIRLSTRNTHTFEAPNVKQEHRTGKVWCVTVPTGAFVARRNGKVFVIGNCINVWRCFADRVVQVAEYATYGADVRYASWVFFHLCAAYGDIMGNIEIAGPGRLVMAEFEHLRELLGAEHNQAKVKAREWEDANSQARWYLYHKPDSLGAGYVYNFETNWSTKPQLMHNFRSCYVTKEVEVKSVGLLKEMLQVRVDDDGGIGVPDSSNIDCKDDRVFAAALAVKAWTDWVRKDMLAQGRTYEHELKEEIKPTPQSAKNVNSVVYRWLARQKDLENAEPPRGPEWMIERGLV